jgi:hypothetical protein
VIRTGEDFGVTTVDTTDAVSAMSAQVEKGFDLALFISSENHRILTHVSAEKVVGIGNLALVAQIEPAACENLCQLLLVDLAIREDRSVYDPVL